MPSDTTSQAQPTATSAGTSPADLTPDEARAAWATASRDTELDRWRDLYALAVPDPEPGPPRRHPRHRPDAY